MQTRSSGIPAANPGRSACLLAGACLFVPVAQPVTGAVPQTYQVQDLTGWTARQLAALPYFDHWSPPGPDDPATFVRVARNGFGIVAGNLGDEGAVIRDGAIARIEAWGAHHWAYWSCDTHDCHYYSGRVRLSPVSDINVFGRVVGRATLTGFSDRSTDAQSHAYLYDPDTGEKIDLTPEARYATVAGINDAGVIIGTYHAADQYHAFHREPDGSEWDYVAPGATVTPSVINNLGWVGGTHITYLVDARIIVTWVARGGRKLEPLPLPPQGSPNAAGLVDINDHGVIVGNTWKQKTPWETGPARWYRVNGVWQTDNLDEVAEGGDLIIDTAVAVNDAGYIIARGHLDGTDNVATRTLLLTPDRFPGPTAIALPPDRLTTTSAVLRGKLNACTRTTTVQFQLGSADGTELPAPPVLSVVTGTTPAIVTAEVSALQPHTTYRFQVRATNPDGAFVSPEREFTTPYDYATWAAEQFGPDAANPAVAEAGADPDQDGRNNFAEYALGSDPRTADEPDWEAKVQAGVLILTLTRPLDRAGVTVEVETAAAVTGPWHGGADFVEPRRIRGAGNMETREYRSLLPADGAAQFLRVRVRPAP